MKEVISNFFKIAENGSNIKTEVLAGITTFMTMSYIIFVNPSIIEGSGMPFEAVMISTCLASGFASILIGLYANYPIGLAPSMGINAFFVFGLVKVMNYSWQVALSAIFIEGILFIILSVFNIRSKILDAIPLSLKLGIPAGIGMFLAFIGFQSSGLVVHNPATLITLGDLHSAPVLLSILGFIMMVSLHILKVKGAILIGILVITVLSIPFGVTQFPDAVISTPPSIMPIFMQMDFSLIKEFFYNIVTFNFSMTENMNAAINFIVIVLVLLFMDLFNTVGTLIGATSKTDLIDTNGNLKNSKQAFMSDAIGTTAGAVMGVTTVTAYIESVTGVEQGGRTGLVAVVIGLLFLFAMFFSPIVKIVPPCATAPALIFVGILMMAEIVKLDFNDWTEMVPAILTVFIMPFTYNIATGIEFGVVSYVVIKFCTGKVKDVSKMMIILAVLFILKEIFFQS